MKAEIKKLPMKEKIARGTKLKHLLDEERALYIQESMRNRETTEQQVEAEKMIGLIHPI